MSRFISNIVNRKLIKDEHGLPIYLANDHQGAVEDVFLYKDTRLGNSVQKSGTNLIKLLGYIADSIPSGSKIDSISVNGENIPADDNKNVNISVPTKLEDLNQDSEHRTVTDNEKDKWNDKQDKLVFQSDNYDAETNKAVTRADVEDAVKPFASCKRWRGVHNSLDEITDPKNGDECAVGEKEYIYCQEEGKEGYWREYGSEGTHIHHGEVVNSDIKDNAAIAQSKIAGLTTSLAEKATNEDLIKEKSERAIADSELADSIVDINKDITDLKEVAHSHDNKAILDTITDKKISQFENDSGFLTEHQDLSEYAKKEELPTKTSDLENDSGFLTEHQDLSSYAKKEELPTKTSELENDSGFLTEHQDISGKVDKDGDKVLSTNDYTNEDKSKLKGIEEGAQVNKIEKITVNGVEQSIVNKTVNIEVSGGGGAEEATPQEVQEGTSSDKMITPNRTAESIKFGLLHNAEKIAGGSDLASEDQRKVQSWLGVNELTFTFNDGTTRTFSFVSNEVISNS